MKHKSNLHVKQEKLVTEVEEHQGNESQLKVQAPAGRGTEVKEDPTQNQA